jgi:long-chain fatty acid transport protein
MKKSATQPRRSVLSAAVCSALLAAALPASANIGMENIAFSAKSMGRAGTDIALGDDASVMNTNPALLSNIGAARADMNLEMMFPEFGYRNTVNDTDGKSPIYVIPSAGYARRLNDRLVLGVAMFNEGGTGTDYGVLNVDNTLLGGTGTSGIEHFSQFGYMVVTPTVAYQISEGLSLGISPQIGYGMLRMKMPMPMDLSGVGTGPYEFGAVDMDGTDVNFRVKLGLSYNAGGRYGFGLAYTSKAAINADGDVTVTSPSIGVMRGKSLMKIGWPSSLKAGAFYDAGPMGRLIGEVQRVKWSEYYDSIPVTWKMPGGDMSFNMNIGMKDQTAWKIGYEYPLNSAITLRAGWAHGKNPIPSTGIIAIFNPIVEDHMTFGLGYQSGKNFEFNVAVERGLKNTVTAAPTHPFPDVQNSQTDMAFWSMALQLSYKW